MSIGQITNTRSVTIAGGNINVGTLKELIDGMSDDAEVSVHQSMADRPGERGTITFKIEEKPQRFGPRGGGNMVPGR